MRGLFHIFHGLFLTGLIGALGIVPVGTVNSTELSDCNVRSASDNVVVIVCRPGLDPDAWRSAGTAACALDFGACNAWIWNDSAKAPEKAPATDIELSESQVRNAVAIWVSEEQHLVVLRKAAQ